MTAAATVRTSIRSFHSDREPSYVGIRHMRPRIWEPAFKAGRKRGVTCEFHAEAAREPRIQFTAVAARTILEWQRQRQPKPTAEESRLSFGVNRLEVGATYVGMLGQKLYLFEKTKDGELLFHALEIVKR